MHRRKARSRKTRSRGKQTKVKAGEKCRLMVNDFSHWSGDELVRQFRLYGLVCLNRVRYGWAPASSHRGSTMGEPIGRRSMRLNQDKRCRRVSPRDVCTRVRQGNRTLSPHTCRKPAMGEPIGRCPTRHLRVIGGCQPSSRFILVQNEQHPVRGA